MKNLSAFQNEFLPIIAGEIKRYIDENFFESTNNLKDIFIYHLGLDLGYERQGKRIRPLIVLLCTIGGGGNWQHALPAVVAVELLHNFSLIHDDIEDNGILRRGMPAVWSKWGLAIGLNAGDSMFAAAFSAISQLVKYYDAQIVLQSICDLSDTCIRLTKGQDMDIQFETKKTINKEDYYEMINGKTAALFSFCAKAGALLAGKNEFAQKEYQKFGDQLGMAFQVYDDWLGIWGDPNQAGKSTFSDLIERKKTLPIILGLQASKRFIDEWKNNSIDSESVKKLAGWLKEDGIEVMVRREFNKWNKGALNSLKVMDCHPEIKSVLSELTNILLIRKS